MSLNLPPRVFVDQWKKSALKETAASQSHFNDICYLVGHQTPAELDPTGQRSPSRPARPKSAAARAGPMDLSDEAILERLLALNLERAASEQAVN